MVNGAPSQDLALLSGGAEGAWNDYSDGPRSFVGAAPSSVHSGGMPICCATIPVTPGPRPNASQAAYFAFPPNVALIFCSDGAPGISAIACDTDGIDGTEDNAGAILLPESIARAAANGVAIKTKLAENDAWGFFDALGDLIVTGPTLTNVNDFRAILVVARPER